MRTFLLLRVCVCVVVVLLLSEYVHFPCVFRALWSVTQFLITRWTSLRTRAISTGPPERDVEDTKGKRLGRRDKGDLVFWDLPTAERSGLRLSRVEICLKVFLIVARSCVNYVVRLELETTVDSCFLRS